MEQRDFDITEDGSWDDIIAFCDRLGDAIERHVDETVHQRFERWRPRQEDTKKDLREKTAQEESLQTTGIEEKSDGMKKEIQHAGHEMRRSGEEVAKRKPRESLKRAEAAGSSAARGVIPSIIRSFRVLEEMLYVNLMGRTSPNYFECGAFTVAIERSVMDRERYRARFVTDDGTLLDAVSTRLEHETE